MERTNPPKLRYSLSLCLASVGIAGCLGDSSPPSEKSQVRTTINQEGCEIWNHNFGGSPPGERRTLMIMSSDSPPRLLFVLGWSQLAPEQVEVLQPPELLGNYGLQLQGVLTNEKPSFSSDSESISFELIDTNQNLPTIKVTNCSLAGADPTA
jgi:hypothetical protein